MTLNDIKDRDSGKIGMVIGLGPSLNEVLPYIEGLSENARDKVSFYCCNLFNQMTKIKTDYWVVTNNQPKMSLKKAHGTYNSQPESIFLFASRINGFSEAEAKKLLNLKYIAMSDNGSGEYDLPLTLKKYTSSEKKYGAVHSVIIHQIALSIITGCKEIFISGVDLDYSKGYVKPGVHQEGVSLGKTFMNSKARKDTIDKIVLLKECAEKVDCNLYTLNPSGPLSKVLEVKNTGDIDKIIKK